MNAILAFGFPRASMPREAMLDGLESNLCTSIKAKYKKGGRLTEAQFAIGSLGEFEFLNAEVASTWEDEGAGLDEISDFLGAEVAVEDDMHQTLRH